jgi:hypothetical protein
MRRQALTMVVGPGPDGGDLEGPAASAAEEADGCVQEAAVRGEMPEDCALPGADHVLDPDVDAAGGGVGALAPPASRRDRGSRPRASSASCPGRFEPPRRCGLQRIRFGGVVRGANVPDLGRAAPGG